MYEEPVYLMGLVAFYELVGFLQTLLWPLLSSYLAALLYDVLYLYIFVSHISLAVFLEVVQSGHPLFHLTLLQVQMQKRLQPPKYIYPNYPSVPLPPRPVLN